MATLDVRGVRKTYGKTTALDGLDFEVGNGEFFVILGPSGAGKTTTLKSVAGLVDIDSGQVSIGGRDMTGVEPYHRNVGMAFESYALYPQKTVSQNLASPLNSGRTGNYTEAQQKERIDQVTTTLGINHLLGRFPRELSNGQRQRTALGRVLVRPADIYLLDEPLSHLDAKLRASMRAELKQLGVHIGHDHAVRDARLPGGARPRRPDRGAARGPAGAGGHPGGDLEAAGGHVRGPGARASRR